MGSSSDTTSLIQRQRELDRRKELRNILETDSVIGHSDQLQERGVKDDSQVHSSIRHLLCAFSVLSSLPGTGGGRGSHTVEYILVIALGDLFV